MIYQTTDNIKFSPTFVVGAPRSGTTILHSLLCTASNCNDYISECTLFTSILRAYSHAAQKSEWEQHTSFYFNNSPITFRDYAARTLKKMLIDIWFELGTKENLLLKDPHLTSLAPSLLNLIPESKFVVSVRNPLDVIASRINVWVNEGKISKNEIPVNYLNHACNEYINSYSNVINLSGHTNVAFFNYENLTDSETRAKLALWVGLKEVGEDKVWQSTRVDVNAMRENSAWRSELYGQRPTMDSVGRHRKTFSTEQISIIENRCSLLYEKLHGFSKNTFSDPVSNE